MLLTIVLLLLFTLLIRYLTRASGTGLTSRLKCGGGFLVSRWRWPACMVIFFCTTMAVMIPVETVCGSGLKEYRLLMWYQHLGRILLGVYACYGLAQAGRGMLLGGFPAFTLVDLGYFLTARPWAARHS